MGGKWRALHLHRWPRYPRIAKAITSANCGDQRTVGHRMTWIAQQWRAGNRLVAFAARFYGQPRALAFGRGRIGQHRRSWGKPVTSAANSNAQTGTHPKHFSPRGPGDARRYRPTASTLQERAELACQDPIHHGGVARWYHPTVAPFRNRRRQTEGLFRHDRGVARRNKPA